MKIYTFKNINDASIKHSNVNITIYTDTASKRYHSLFYISDFSTSENIIVLAIRTNELLPGPTTLVWEQFYSKGSGFIRIESIIAYTATHPNDEQFTISCTIAYIKA